MPAQRTRGQPDLACESLLDGFEARAAITHGLRSAAPRYKQSLVECDAHHQLPELRRALRSVSA
jgi:hypothetical protein